MTGGAPGASAAIDARALFEGVDWSAHPLGPVDQWPAALKIAVSNLLGSPESLYLLWGEDGWFFFNQAYAPILGPRLHDAMGARFAELWADAYEAVRPFYQRALAGENTRAVDMPIEMAPWGEPEQTWWSFSYAPSFDERGQVAGVLCLTNETTQQVRAAAALEETQRALQRAQEAGQVGVFSIEIASNRIHGTPEFFHLFGLAVQDSIPADVIERMVVPEDAQIISNARTRASESAPLEVEYRIRRADTGELRCIERRGEFERDETDRPLRLIGVVQDVTERRAAQEALATLNATLESRVRERTAERNLLATIFEETDAFVHVVDLDYRWLAINRAGAEEFERVFGMRPKVGDCMLDLLADQPEEHAAVAAVWSRALGGEEFTAIAEFGAPDRMGERRTYEMKFNTLRNDEGRQIGAFQVVTDVTERERAAAELAQTQEALRQSQKMEAVGQLTGGLAHDFNNMLTAVSGGLELLQKRVEQQRYDELRRYIDMARTGADRAAALTQRLLAFSRRQTLAPTAVDPGQLVTGIQGFIAHTLGPAIDLHVEHAPDLWPILVDVPQLENALLNLCINARDAMPEGGQLVIEIANCPSDAEAPGEPDDLRQQDHVVIAVHDTGTGIAPDVLSRVFDPFFTTKPIGEGTGLGLSMVYGFTRQSGGQVRIESELGEGTTIRLYLPRHLGETAAAVDQQVARSAQPDRGGHTVLVVEDEGPVRSLICEVLVEAGHVVIEASDGASGIARMQEAERLDLLVTDIGLPGGLNGRQVANAGQALRPELKVLFVTGYAADGELGGEPLPPGTFVLTKPFVLPELERRVRDLLNEPRPD